MIRTAMIDEWLSNWPSIKETEVLMLNSANLDENYLHVSSFYHPLAAP